MTLHYYNLNQYTSESIKYMLREQTIQLNMKMYMQRMENKLKQDKQKLDKLQQKIFKAACLIQRSFRKYILDKKTRAAKKIQLFWKIIKNQIKYRRHVLQKVKKMISYYKIYYFVSSKLRKTKNSQQIKVKTIIPTFKYKKNKIICQQIKCFSKQYLVLLSALHSELHYNKKYMTFDKKKFSDEWKSYQKKQRQWMWEQIKKKWIRKDAVIWINDNQKEINGQKYVNNLIEQNYMKHFQTFQKNQQRLVSYQIQLKSKILNASRVFAQMILKNQFA